MTRDITWGPVDWSHPIEAWNPITGKTVPMQLEGGRGGSRYTQDCPDPSTSNTSWREDGANRCVGSPWRIRNVAQPAADAPTAPSGGEVGPEVVERCIALVRAAAERERTGYNWTFPQEWHAEARAIVALLPEPVDGDLVEARKICERINPEMHAVSGDLEEVALAAIKRGRALAAGDR